MTKPAPRPTNELPPPRGILRAPRPDGLLEARRAPPPASLKEHVHHVWSSGWSLRSPHSVTTLPFPAALVLVTPRGAELHGAKTARVTRTLAGEGRMFGVSFRPVMFRALLGRSTSTITDRVVPLESVLGPTVSKWVRALWRARDLETEIGLAEEFFGCLVTSPNELQLQLRDCVERIASDRDLVRVEDLCDASGLDARTLQRRFSDYVGLSPKSVIGRYRMHEAAIRLASDNAPSLAALAASLGYSDQAHFARDFKRTVGETPRAFAAFRAVPRPSDRLRSSR